MCVWLRQRKFGFGNIFSYLCVAKAQFALPKPVFDIIQCLMCFVYHAELFAVVVLFSCLYLLLMRASVAMFQSKCVESVSFENVLTVCNTTTCLAVAWWPWADIASAVQLLS